MAKSPAVRLTTAEGRKFGIPVGIAFLVLGLVVAWRGGVVASPIIGGVGVGLILAALLIPTHLGPVYRAWMGMALLLSKVTTPILMGVIYFLVITPIALLMRLMGRNPMVRKPVDGSFWILRAEGSGRRSDLERQF